MTTKVVKRLLGGLGHSQRVPTNFQDDVGQWVRSGAGESKYELRHYVFDGQEWAVWTEVSVADSLSWGTVEWFVRCLTDVDIELQKEILNESMSATERYTQVITAVGYAALFALLAQSKDSLTDWTYFFTALALLASVACFAVIEVLGLIVRSTSMRKVKLVVEGDPEAFAQAMIAHRSRLSRWMRRTEPWESGIRFSAIGFGCLAFCILLSAFVHGLWIGLGS